MKGIPTTASSPIASRRFVSSRLCPYESLSRCGVTPPINERLFILVRITLHNGIAQRYGGRIAGERDAAIAVL